MAGMQDLFAPAYNPNDPTSVAAVNDWQAKRYPVNAGNVGQTAMPGQSVDPNALQVMSQGGAYDMNARRDAIAAQVQANNTAAAPAAASGPYHNPYAGAGWWSTFEANVGPAAARQWVEQQRGGGGGAAAAAAPASGGDAGSTPRNDYTYQGSPFGEQLPGGG